MTTLIKSHRKRVKVARNTCQMRLDPQADLVGEPLAYSAKLIECALEQLVHHVLCDRTGSRQ